MNLKSHSYFKRDNYDVISKVYVTVSQAVLGHILKIKTLEGEKEVVISPGT